MKEKLLNFVQHLTPFDYILFGASFALFILFLILAMVLHRKTTLSLLLILIAFAFLFLGPTVGYLQLHRYLFAHELRIDEVKQLSFTDALLVHGALTNRSKRTFEACVITVGAHKVSGNPVMDTIFPYNPFKKSSITINGPITPSQEVEFKLFLEPFRYSKEYNTTSSASCR